MVQKDTGDYLENVSKVLKESFEQFNKNMEHSLQFSHAQYHEKI